MLRRVRYGDYGDKTNHDFLITVASSMASAPIICRPSRASRSDDAPVVAASRRDTRRSARPVVASTWPIRGQSQRMSLLTSVQVLASTMRLPAASCRRWSQLRNLRTAIAIAATSTPCAIRSSKPLDAGCPPSSSICSAMAAGDPRDERGVRFWRKRGANFGSPTR